MARKLDLTDEQRRERDKAFAAARGEADKLLREAHTDEWNRLFQAALAERGVEWAPKPKPEQEALDTIANLLEKYPDLAGQLADRLAATA